MNSKCFHFLCLFVWLLLFCFSYADSGSNDGKIQCIPKEKEALLQFKQGAKIDDDCGLFTSWVGQECCQWHGIRCNNHSGHVIRLDVNETPYDDLEPTICGIRGKVSPSIVQLKHLEYLDLSYSYFNGQPILSFIGSFVNLKYLKLSNCYIDELMDHQLANLSSLTSLDLGYSEGLNLTSLKWLSYLTLLTDINLSSVNLSQATDWMQIVNNLPSLKSLQMDNCDLSLHMSLSLLEYTNSSTSLHTLSLQGNNLNNKRILEWVSNLTRLSSTFSYLDLSRNFLWGHIPSSFGNMQSLLHFNLSENKVQGPIPETFSNLKNLVNLDLSENDFEGSKWNPEVLGSLCSLQMLCLGHNNITNELATIIQPLSRCAHRPLVYLNIQNNNIWGSLSDEIGMFSSLRELDLSYNQLNGAISPSMGQLLMIERLALYSNSLKDTISDHHFSNLSRLIVLDLSDNQELVLNFSANWVPPFQLNVIHLRSCKMGPYFPKWLLTQTNFSSLDIFNASISDAVPTLFWNSLPPNLEYMNMSKNMINGTIPNILISLYNSPVIDSSSNSFHGGIPSFFINASSLFLHDNNFSDFAPFFCPKTQAMLYTLRLSNNKLSGELPSCWDYFYHITFLSLDNNNIYGKIPESIGKLFQLQALHLRNNRISGKLPMALQDLLDLQILDLSYNSLTGHIPDWIRYPAPVSLVVLNLRNNNFLGSVPLSLCQLSGLQMLDFSSNQLSGFIPNCIWQLTSMTSPHGHIEIMYSDMAESYVDFEWIMWKGKERSFTYILREVKVIDMSNNKLEGPVPDGISRLTGLRSVDLSRNRLNGSIPQHIGNLASLEYLDLSRNLLCGEIPGSLSIVSSLEALDVSYNNLSGQIPHGTQLQSFHPTSYIGNPGLCGEPLPKCPGDPTQAKLPKQVKSRHQDNYHDDDNENLFPGLYISVVLGFIIGFWGVCGTLVIKRSWRNAFYQFFDDIKDKLHMLVLVNKARVLRRNN